jgi:hypothetical protein
VPEQATSDFAEALPNCGRDTFSGINNMIFSSGSFSVVAAVDGIGSVNFDFPGSTVLLSLVQAQQVVKAIGQGLSTGLVATVINTSATIYIQGNNSILNPEETSFSVDGVTLTTPGVNIWLLVSGSPYVVYLTIAQAQQLVNALGVYLVTYQ